MSKARVSRAKQEEGRERGGGSNCEERRSESKSGANYRFFLRLLLHFTPKDNQLLREEREREREGGSWSGAVLGPAWLTILIARPWKNGERWEGGEVSLLKLTLKHFSILV